MRKNASRHEPIAPPGPASPPFSSQSPPCSRQISSARSSHGSTGWSADSKPSVSSASRAVAGAVLRRLERVDEAAVRRLELGLGERADGLRAAEERGEAHRAPGAVDRPRAHADPRLGDEAEDPFRAEQQPVGRGAGARPGQAARHPVARRRRPRGRTRRGRRCGSGAWRSARRRASRSSRRASTARTTAGRSAASARARRAAPRSAARSRPRRCAPRARPVDLAQLVDRPEVDRDRAVEAVGHARLDAADDARAAAVRDDRRIRARPPTRGRPRSRASSRGRATASGDVLVARRAARGRCRGRTGRGRARRARRRRPCRSRRGAARRETRGAGSAVGSNGTGSSGSVSPEAEQPDEAGRGRARSPSEIAASSNPQPQRLRTRMRAGPYPQGPMPALPPSSPAARGRPTTCEARWSDEHYAPPPRARRGGRRRHRGAARARARRATTASPPGSSATSERDGGLVLDLQPLRWALRLVEGDASCSVAAMCLTRDSDGRWLAGRRATWLSSWAGRWALGAGGAVDVGENPVDTLARELREEWSVEPERLQVEALVRLPHDLVMFVGQAWLPRRAPRSRPTHEHDAHAWWPRRRRRLARRGPRRPAPIPVLLGRPSRA